MKVNPARQILFINTNLDNHPPKTFSPTKQPQAKRNRETEGAAQESVMK